MLTIAVEILQVQTQAIGALPCYQDRGSTVQYWILNQQRLHRF